MKILLFGKNGQLGSELNRCLQPLGLVLAVDYPEIDLANGLQVRGFLKDNRPDVIVNAAAYTAVDDAENDQDMAWAVNAKAPGILAEEARFLNAVLIHYSTDYVFDGKQGVAYVETDQPNPVNVYGQSKLEGEKDIRSIGGSFLILRTSWVYSLGQGGFVQKVLKWSRENEILRIVSDQVGSPTWARMLAEVTAQLLAKTGDQPYAWIKEKSGLYHLGGEGIVSRMDWAKAIQRYDPKPEEQTVTEILPAKSTEFPTPAKRPFYTPLNCNLFANTFRLQLPPWEDALRLAMEDINRYE